VGQVSDLPFSGPSHFRHRLDVVFSSICVPRALLIVAGSRRPHQVFEELAQVAQVPACAGRPETRPTVRTGVSEPLE
jgi:hypothetical protein